MKQRMTRRYHHLSLTIAAVVLAGAALLFPLPANDPSTANEPLDQMKTGAIAGGPILVEPRGSQAFRSALAVLSAGDASSAYSLAATLPSVVERQAIQWAAIYNHRGKIDYRAIQKFAVEAPDFAATSLYQTRLEQSLLEAAASPLDIIAALGNSKPITVDGQIMLATAYLDAGQRSTAEKLIQSIWIDNFLTEDQEVTIMHGLGSLLTSETHWQRAMHLMMHDRARASERLMEFLTPAQQSLVTARAAVSRKADNAKALLDAVPVELQANPVFIFSRAQRARQFELWQSAIDWLTKAPQASADADEWWYERRALMRRLLDVGNAQLAYLAAEGYQNGSAARMVDAQFHAGWIALSFLNEPAMAAQHFTEMAKYATLPDTIAQANYWLGRAEDEAGHAAAAKLAHERAAPHGTTYYGQLARAELGLPSVNMRPLPFWADSEAVFDTQKPVQAIRLLAANGQTALARLLLREFGTTRQKPAELVLAAKLAQEIGAQQIAVAIANAAALKGIPLDPYNFPELAASADYALPADRAAVFAVIRQESMFQVDAVSPVGARGLMQLMPGTAQDVAKMVGEDYSPARLVTDAEYNLLLGSTYLAKQLSRYNGSLVLAAAAYNAGPGNADKWIKAYGDPRADNVDPVLWVELIPFQETRTYVKRVLGNYLVYRERLGHKPLTLHQALRSIG